MRGYSKDLYKSVKTTEEIRENTKQYKLKNPCSQFQFFKDEIAKELGTKVEPMTYV